MHPILFLKYGCDTNAKPLDTSFGAFWQITQMQNLRDALALHLVGADFLRLKEMKIAMLEQDDHRNGNI